MVLTTVLRNIKDTGYPLRVRVWSLLTANVWQLGLSDGAMVFSTALSVPLQKMFRRSKGIMRWSKGGIWIQSIFEMSWLTLWINWPFMLRWTWTAQVFLTLHTLTLLMKMHSYAFYNGHLGETERRLQSLDHPESASLAAAVKYPASPTRFRRTAADGEHEKEAEDKMKLAQLRQDLATELTSPLGRVTYPQNLTLANYADYVLCPTLCYELEYPRTPERNWMELFWKSLAVFGCIFLLTVTSEEFIVPVLAEGHDRLQMTRSFSERSLIMGETISMLLFPFMVTMLLVFLVIFEYVLGAFAEITCFADRHFYSDWWNSCDWYHLLASHIWCKC